jgi:hypothetical protein
LEIKDYKGVAGQIGEKMGHTFELFRKRNRGGRRLEGEEKKGLTEKSIGRRRVLIVRMSLRTPF